MYLQVSLCVNDESAASTSPKYTLKERDGEEGGEAAACSQVNFTVLQFLDQVIELFSSTQFWKQNLALRT